jgi:glyoxalase family protein
MSTSLHGIHHITAIAGDAQQNLDFYAGVLGLRLVKKTVNFDDPYTYHFYFGDPEGRPGTIITFFPWGEEGIPGRRGSGSLDAFAFAIPEGTAGEWASRLHRYGVSTDPLGKRFDETVLAFRDPTGLRVELIESGNDRGAVRGADGVPAGMAIRGLHSATILHRDQRPTADFFASALGFTIGPSDSGRYRFIAGEGGPGNVVDIVVDHAALPGRMGRGMIHHLAFRIADDEAELRIREHLLMGGWGVSPVRDRQYFHSIYFNEPGGVLLEVATDPPGFLIDEQRDSLGEALRLPPWFEPQRRSIEQALPVLVEPHAVVRHPQEHSHPRHQ